MIEESCYLRLGNGVHLKILESPCAYNVLTDELYALSEEALRFLHLCDGTRTMGELAPEEEFLDFCLREGVLEARREPEKRDIEVGRNEVPSLRYLMVEITNRCNLQCLHCYLGEAGAEDLPFETLRGALDDFEDLGGLRLLVTGGEPLLYPRFRELNESLEGRTYRSVLITNGTLMDRLDPAELNFQEVQFSVDGLREGHDLLRGEGTFERVWSSLHRTLEAGVEVSVATVIHRRNLHELEELGSLLRDAGVSSWTLEYPVAWGRLASHPELMPEVAEAAPFMEMEWGSGPHEGAEGYACGAHLACLDPQGNLVKCGYYREVSGGRAGDGLRQAWLRLPKMRLEGACTRCPLLSECGGGCRFRAQLMEGPGGRDLLMCARMGFRV